MAKQGRVARRLGGRLVPQPGPRMAPRMAPRSAALAIGWFPSAEWGPAVERWPSLAEEIPVDFDGYRREVEARTKRIRRNLPGQPLQLVTLTISGLETYARDFDRDPGMTETRAACAAWLLQRGEGVPWPPHRNDLCWCRSGLKYKRCCGPVPAAPEPSEAEAEVESELESELEPAAPDGAGEQSSEPIEQSSEPTKQS